MKKSDTIIVGSGISGLSAVIAAAGTGAEHILLVSPYSSERAQSSMAAGGINGALDTKGEGDSVELHIQETMRGGCDIADPVAVAGLCSAAPGIIRWLEELGMVFSRDERGEVDQRAFGGQSKRRTAFAGACTGKQIVTTLNRAVRRLEAAGVVERRMGTFFLEALVMDGTCFGCVLFDYREQHIYPVLSDAVILATGGQNTLFGKTTGSAICDGAAAAAVFRQGARLKNLEMIQYHPTTIETPQKRMLITEAARGEGGRLFYLEEAGTEAVGAAGLGCDDRRTSDVSGAGSARAGQSGGLSVRAQDRPSEDTSRAQAPPLRQVGEVSATEGGASRRVYFMEEKYGERGNLMPRDVVSREMFETGRQIFLDISFLGEDLIMTRLREVFELCRDYLGLDVTRDPIPVAPAVHFFMGGIAVGHNLETDIANLFAIGECASIYHGANRLGGNSLLAAIYSGRIAGEEVARRRADTTRGGGETRDGDDVRTRCGERATEACRERMAHAVSEKSTFPWAYLQQELSGIMNENLGISRTADGLEKGLSDIDFFLGTVDKLHFDIHATPVLAYFAHDRLLLAKAILMSALARRESRGAHFRRDHPKRREEFEKASFARLHEGEIEIDFEVDAR